MKDKQKKAKLLDTVGIACGLVVLAIMVISIISANTVKYVGDKSLPANAVSSVGTAQGRNGEIRVEVAATADRICRMRIVEHTETDGIGTVAVDEMPARIYEAQSLEVDASSGATISSDAIKLAVADALEKAGLDPAAFGAAALGAADDPAADYPITTDADGKITAVGAGKGIEGTVLVQVTADAEKIYAVEILEQNETEGIGSVAVERLPGQIVDANSILVDSISGATVSSTAIKDAVRSALSKAGLDVAVFGS